jgi:MATE family multidrug resistance protein
LQSADHKDLSAELNARTGGKTPTRKQETATILRIALPLTTAYIAEMGMVITDMVIVGRLGSAELAAVGLAGDLFWILLLVGMGVLTMVGVFAAQALGAGDSRGVVSAAEQGMFAALLSSLPVMLGVWLLGPALSLAGQDAEVVALVDDYARILTWGVPPVLLFTVLRNYSTALGRSGIIGWLTLAALALNAALNYTLVYGHFGLPALGVAGAGLGTTIVNWLMFIAFLAYVLRSNHFEGCRPSLRQWQADAALLRSMFALGIPVALSQIVNGGLFSAAAIAVGIIGATTLAAQQIIYSIIYLAMSAAAALGDAVRVRVAYGVGVSSMEAVRQSSRIAFTIAAGATLLGTLVLWFAPSLLVGIFLDTDADSNQDVLDIAIALSAVAGVFLFLDSMQMVVANALRGLRDTRTPLLISLLGHWVLGLGLGLSLCFPLGFSAAGLWAGLVMGSLLATGLMYLRFHRCLLRIAHKLDSD